MGFLQQLLVIWWNRTMSENPFKPKVRNKPNRTQQNNLLCKLSPRFNLIEFFADKLILFCNISCVARKNLKGNFPQLTLNRLEDTKPCGTKNLQPMGQKYPRTGIQPGPPRNSSSKLNSLSRRNTQAAPAGKRYHCNFCEKFFARSDTLNNHIELRPRKDRY